MKISFAANHGEIGGGEVMLLAMAEAARSLGHNAEVIGPAGTVLDRATEAGFRTVTVHGAGTVAYLQGLRRWARTTKPHVLWCNGLKPAVATSFLPNRVVHLHSLPTGPLAAMAKAARLGANRVVVPSRWMSMALGGSPYVLPNWTAGLAFSPPETLPPAPPVRVGFLGRLTSEKGAQVLADAISQLNAEAPGRYQVVVGGASRFTDEDDAQAAHEALAALQPPSEFLGWVEREQFFSSVDLAVFPSVFPESFGLVAAEAMASGCPFVITDAGALPEVTEHDAAFVAAPGDSTSLASAIRGASLNYASATVESSRKRWEDQYSPAAGAARFEELLKSLEATA